jgi:hypothetical protein
MDYELIMLNLVLLHVVCMLYITLVRDMGFDNVK